MGCAGVAHRFHTPGMRALRSLARSKIVSANCLGYFVTDPKDLRENNLINIAPRLGSDLDGTIEKHSRHSTAMVRVFRLRPVQRWPEDWMRDCPSYFLSGPKYIKRLFVCREKNGQRVSKQHKMAEKNVFLKRGGRSRAHPSAAMTFASDRATTISIAEIFPLSLKGTNYIPLQQMIAVAPITPTLCSLSHFFSCDSHLHHLGACPRLAIVTRGCWFESDVSIV